MSATVNRPETFTDVNLANSEHYESLDEQDRADDLPRRPSYRREYDSRVIARARSYRQAGWTYEQIRALLHVEFGARPSDGTLAAWADPDFAARANERLRLRARRRRSSEWMFKLGGRTPSPEYQAAFVRRLRAEGMPVESIVRVCRVVFDDPWSRDRVKALLAAES